MRHVTKWKQWSEPPYNSNVLGGGGRGQLTFYSHLNNYTNVIFKNKLAPLLRMFYQTRKLIDSFP